MTKLQLEEMYERIQHNDSVLAWQLVGIIFTTFIIFGAAILLYLEYLYHEKLWKTIGVAILLIGVIVGIVFWSIHINDLRLDLRHLRAVYDIEKRVI